MTDAQIAARLERERVDYVAALADTLRRAVALLQRKPAVRSVILFGSYARGRRDLFTDLDLLVVMESDVGFVERTIELRREIAAQVDLDLLVYTPGELEKVRHRGFVREAIESGEVLLAR